MLNVESLNVESLNVEFTPKTQAGRLRILNLFPLPTLDNQYIVF